MRSSHGEHLGGSMRRLTLWIASTAAAVILLFTYRTSFGAAGGTAVVEGPAAGSPAVGGSAAGPSVEATGPAVTVDGPVARTRYGPVQVRVELRGRTITDVLALRRPDGNDRDTEINAVALPRLRSEVLAAQSAHVDTVSGATYTSKGYLTSLQGALDAAHVG
ncbi:FMN-binding protein [Dactylosporangium sp. NPDC051541]|uniref:FMN-binding protein n=1 Tax=Dactylosporangium sp. NPDC051541 TaxID=3363977 RepID=UPI00379262FE